MPQSCAEEGVTAMLNAIFVVGAEEYVQEKMLLTAQAGWTAQAGHDMQHVIRPTTKHTSEALACKKDRTRGLDRTSG